MEAPVRIPTPLFPRLLALLLAACFAASSPAAAATGSARVFLTVDEALALAFPDCDVRRTTAFLTDEQARRAEALLGAELPSRIAYPYVARRDGRVVGTAYFDNHKVRTLKETVMVVVDPTGVVSRLEVLAFAEPEDYLPRGKWYAQFIGRGLDDELRLKRGIRGVTGATLTARATTSCVRRVLALHHALYVGPSTSPR